ncbi:MAG: hypothetical protein MUC99_10010, partial [Anaerolineae bacterium]|nr:hypothetical protein [Anaerolineae bacterium]
MTDPTPTPSPQTPPPMKTVEAVAPQRLTVTQRRRPNTLGCVFTLVTALACAGVLIVAGLFLPPVNLYERLFGTPYVALDAANNAVALDGLTVALDPADAGTGFGVAIAALSPEAFASPDAPTWAQQARAAVPRFLALQSAVYDLATTGTAPAQVGLDLVVPQGVALDSLDAYGYDIETGRWRFLASQPTTAGTLSIRLEDLPDRVALFVANPIDPQVIIPLDITETLDPDVARLATIVLPSGLSPNAAGQLVGGLAPGWQIGAGYRVMPLVQNFTDPRALDVETVRAIVGSGAARRAHAEQLAAVALGGGFSGVFIDYRGLPDESRDDFSAFIRTAAQTLRANGLSLGVIVPAAQNVEGAWVTGAYDWRAIGAAADFVEVELPLNPTEYAAGENRYVEALLRWATREVSRYKLIAGLSAFSVREVGGAFSTVEYQAALAKLGNVRVTSELSSVGSVEPGGVILAELDGLTAVPGQDP